MVIRILQTYGIWVLCMASLLFGAPGGYLPMTSAIDTAELIVSGTITGGLYEGAEYTLDISVDHVFKGPDNLSAVQIRGVLPQLVRAHGPIDNRDRGIWFLQRDSVVNWSPVKIQSPMAVRSSYYWLPKASATGEAASEIKPLIVALVGAIAGGIAVNDRNDEDLLRLSASLKQELSPELRSLFESLLLSSSARARLLGAAVLARYGSYKALAEMEHFLQNHNRTQLYDGMAVYQALGKFRGTDPQAMVILGRIAGNEKDIEIARKAAESLMHIRTREAIAVLAGLLDSADASIRQQAVGGLSLFAAGIPMSKADHDTPAKAAEYFSRVRANDAAKSAFESEATQQNFHLGSFPTKEEENRLVEFWKSWWATNSQSALRN